MLKILRHLKILDLVMYIISNGTEATIQVMIFIGAR